MIALSSSTLFGCSFGYVGFRSGREGANEQFTWNDKPYRHPHSSPGRSQNPRGIPCTEHERRPPFWENLHHRIHPCGIRRNPRYLLRCRPNHWYDDSRHMRWRTPHRCCGFYGRTKRCPSPLHTSAAGVVPVPGLRMPRNRKHLRRIGQWPAI